MATQALILNITEETAGTLPLTKAFEPVYEWDNDSRQFSSKQVRDGQGRSLWQAEALINTGYGFQTTPARVRVWGHNRPDVVVDGERLLEVSEVVPQQGTHA